MNKKGSVLMISLWILAILVIFALGLGHRASINLRLARYQRDRLKATYLAKAGINRAIVELENDAKDNAYDSLDETWGRGFENIEIVEGSDEKFTVRITDEDRKININNIDTPEKEQILVKLFESAEVEKPEDLKNLIIKWVSPATEGEEENSEHIYKNTPFRTPEELMAVLEHFYGKDNLEIAREKYNKIRELSNIFTGGKININTSTSDILTILAKSVTEDIEPSILITEIKRNTFANQEAIDNFTISDNPQLQEIYNNIKWNFTYQSNYFKIISDGKVGNITKKITAIYDRNGDKIVYWHEN